MRGSHVILLAIGLAAGFAIGFSVRSDPPGESSSRDAPDPDRRSSEGLAAAAPSDPDGKGGLAPVEAGDHPIPEAGDPSPATPAVLADSAETEADRLVRTVREGLGAAGVRLDATRAEMIEASVRSASESLDGKESFATARRATRRETEARLERQIRAVLTGEQLRTLDERLDGRSFVETLPGGGDGDTLSSTGATVEKVESLVLENLRRRVGIPRDVHPGIHDAVSRYVATVRSFTGELTSRRGRGFVEAICSGPTPHSEAARRARESADYGPASLETRARLWRFQADLEEALLPWLEESQRVRLRDARPTGLRFLPREE